MTDRDEPLPVAVGDQHHGVDMSGEAWSAEQ